MSLSSALEQLANYRTNNTRASQEIFEKGSIVLKSKKKLGDEGWAFLEQLALAAIDVGRLDVADECLKQFTEKFPDSPRVDVLTGIRMEATESPLVALQFYDELMQNNPTNVGLWKRKISVLRRIGNVEKATEELVRFLDTFYTDLEGWLELADLYTSCSLYTSALQALSHALLLAPQNPFTFLQFAETAYTGGDLPLAMKMFLMVVDIGEQDISNPTDNPSVGINARGWWGVKLCARRLLTSRSASISSPSNTMVPKNLKELDELATERVLSVYHTDSNSTNRNEVLKWLETH